MIETLDRRKEQMIASLWANSNYDDDKGTRKQAIEEIEENFEQVAQAILNPEAAQEEEIDADNPFWAAGEKGKAKLEAHKTDGSVKDALDFERFIDQ